MRKEHSYILEISLVYGCIIAEYIILPLCTCAGTFSICLCICLTDPFDGEKIPDLERLNYTFIYNAK